MEHVNLGEFDDAMELFEEALEIFHDTGARLDEGIVLNRIGLVSWYQGETAVALEYYEQALAAHREVGNRWDEGVTLGNIGLLHAGRGQPGKALELYEAALAILREVGDRSDEGLFLMNMGDLYRGLGQWSLASENLSAALVINREVGNRQYEAATLRSMGILFRNLGQLSDALGAYLLALQIVRDLGDRYQMGLTLNNLAELYWSLEMGELAVGAWSEALEIYRDLGSPRAVALMLANVINATATVYEPQMMAELWEQQLPFFRSIEDPYLEAYALSSLGAAREASGDLEAALDAYLAALAAQESVREAVQVDELRTSMAEQVAPVYRRAVVVALGLDRAGQAFELSERARARTFLDQLGNVRLDPRRGAAPELVDEEQRLRAELSVGERQLRSLQNRPRREQDAGELQMLHESLQQKRQAYAAILTRLKIANPEYTSLVSVSPLGLAEIQSLLEPGTTLVSYHLADDRTDAFIVTQTSFDTVRLPASEAEMRAAIEELRDFADLGSRHSASDRLYQWLIEPIRPMLRTESLAIVPSGPLYYLPFALLSDGSRYLVDDYATSYLPSASALEFVNAKRKPAEGEALALAYSRAAGLPQLRFASDEALDVVALYGGEVLLDRQATESALVAAAPQARIVHLAAHGLLNQASPLFTRIVLAADDQTDGALEVHEVYAVDLTQADLVVLSACNTQLGPASRGDDVISLNRAFIYAGSPTVMASLWSVDDQATRDLMRAFYTHLRGGMSKGAALQAAQREIRETYPHPYYWAAFVLTGDLGVSSN